MKENAAIAAWLKTLPARRVCFLCCGKGDWRGLQVHHIERKGQVHNEREDWPENLFLACAPCHEGRLATMRHSAQLALKWVHDRCGHADLRSFVTAWLRVYDPELKAPNRVTPEEVEAFLPIIDPRTAHLPPLPR